MYDEQIYLPAEQRYPKVPPERRVSAFLIDFVVVWIISSLVTNIVLEFLTFSLTWLILRVVVVDRNHGQSLGRWALDMKVLDARFNKIPPLISLIKREGILCLASFLAMIGLKINFYNFLSMLLLVAPLIADGVVALTNPEYYQAFHDRYGQTIIIQTRRGFSLDLRLKKLINQLKRDWQKRKPR